MIDRNFGGVIWTNHALAKLQQRGIRQGDAWATWRSSEQSRKGKVPGAWIYYRTYGNDRIEVVAKKNEKGQWLILSVWSRHIYGVTPKESFLTFLFKRIFGK